MTLEEKVRKASAIIEHPKKLKVNFSALYPFTTENINGYLPHFMLKNKSLLTVGSSSDQVFNAIEKGCQDITVVDICSFTKEYYELKKAALLSLPLEEYLDFFTMPQRKTIFHKKKDPTFTKERYQVLRDALSCEESFAFWEELTSLFPMELIRNNLFINDNHPKEINQKTNSYLLDDNHFKQTREKILEVNPSFQTGNIFQIDFNRKFDNIWLSNLFDYGLNKEAAKNIDQLIEQLNDKGKILLYYLYAVTLFGEEPELYDMMDPMNVLKYLPIGIEMIGLPGIDSLMSKKNRTKDAVLIYQKKDTK